MLCLTQFKQRLKQKVLDIAEFAVVFPLCGGQLVQTAFKTDYVTVCQHRACLSTRAHTAHVTQLAHTVNVMSISVIAR